MLGLSGDDDECETDEDCDENQVCLSVGHYGERLCIDRKSLIHTLSHSFRHDLHTYVYYNSHTHIQCTLLLTELSYSSSLPQFPVMTTGVMVVRTTRKRTLQQGEVNPPIVAVAVAAEQLVQPVAPPELPTVPIAPPKLPTVAMVIPGKMKKTPLLEEVTVHALPLIIEAAVVVRVLTLEAQGASAIVTVTVTAIVVVTVQLLTPHIPMEAEVEVELTTILWGGPSGVDLALCVSL